MSDWSSDVCSSDLVLGFLLPGVLAALVAWRLRASLDDGAPWAARIGAWLALLSALAFAAQGLLPLDPRDLESDASRMHATMWTLWWVALLPAAVLLAFGSRARGPSRALGAASVALAVVIVLLALLPLDLLAPAVAQRVVFARSEEHTSELQSLMRISYAVFCL